MNGHVAGDELLCWVVEGLQPGRAPDGLRRAPGRRRVRDPGPRAQARAARSTLRPVPASCCRSGWRCRPGRPHSPRMAPTTDELQRHADRQLYANKHGDAEHFTAGRRELTWAATLARAVDARMATPIEHSTIVARYAAGIAAAAGLERRRTSPTCASPRCCTTSARWCFPTASCRSRTRWTTCEYEEVKRHPEDGRGADQPRRGHGHDRRLGAPLARALRRVRLPRRSRRRGDPARLSDPAGGGRVRRDHERPSVPRRAVADRGAGRSCAATPGASSTRAAWTRWRSTSPTPGMHSQRPRRPPRRPQPWSDPAARRGRVPFGDAWRILHRRLDDAARVPRARDGARRARGRC